MTCPQQTVSGHLRSTSLPCSELFPRSLDILPALLWLHGSMLPQTSSRGRRGYCSSASGSWGIVGKGWGEPGVAAGHDFWQGHLNCRQHTADPEKGDHHIPRQRPPGEGLGKLQGPMGTSSQWAQSMWKR